MRQPFLVAGSQAGVSTIAMVVIAGVLFTLSLGIFQILDQRKTYVEMVRQESQVSMLKQKITNAARSRLAMERSARAQGSSSPLYQCIINETCRTDTSFRSFKLYNGGGQLISGKKTLSGDACSGDCPMEIEVSYAVNCGAGKSTCSEPAEILTQYKIISNSKSYFGGKTYEANEGVASLATFVCPEDEYISGISKTGEISCQKAIASRYVSLCETGSAAYGLSEDGLLKCAPIVDYCKNPIAFSYVMDTSASMRSESKLSASKRAGANLIDRLTKGDQGSLTRFDSSAENVSALTDKFGDLKRQLNRLQPKGLTNMSAGLELGAKNFANLSGSEKVMVFLSDGFHNRGDVDPVALAKTIKDSGVRIFAVGFGKNPDRDRLMQIASSPGDYKDARDAKDLLEVFENLESVLCRD